MNKNETMPAHPVKYGTAEMGLTKLEYFTAAALTGLLAKYDLKQPEDQHTVGRMAAQVAQTTLAELDALVRGEVANG